jgi:hypothetical protein
MGNTNKKPTLNVPVTYGGVSFGKGKAGVPIKIDPAKVPGAKAEEVLLGAQLEAALTFDANAAKDVAGQGTLPGATGAKTVKCTVETGKLGRTPKQVDTRLSVPISALSDEDIVTLAHGSGAAGSVNCVRVGDAKDDVGDED